MSAAEQEAGRRRRGRRTVNSELGPAGVDTLLAASIEVMSEHGYHGTSVRDIAHRAGVSPAALYHHFPSKHDVLVTIMDRGIEELLERTGEALSAAGPRAIDQLCGIVDVHVRFHLEDQHGTMLGTSEVRALAEPFRGEHLAKRRKQQRFFDRVLLGGTREGVFHTAYPRDAARAIVVMCTGVASWYRPEGPHSRTEIARRYQELALDLAGRRIG
ncbi:TetR/AcrR family transcriptional regulator [Tamaricihabitans halophyticus]|nr:TetR/AcrR family transcriptional regulator [Tamaricihabitans halophyticus]